MLRRGRKVFTAFTASQITRSQLCDAPCTLVPNSEPPLSMLSGVNFSGSTGEGVNDKPLSWRDDPEESFSDWKIVVQIAEGDGADATTHRAPRHRAIHANLNFHATPPRSRLRNPEIWQPDTKGPDKVCQVSQHDPRRVFEQLPRHDPRRVSEQLFGSAARSYSAVQIEQITTRGLFTAVPCESCDQKRPA